jgi:hypothetical protein
VQKHSLSLKKTGRHSQKKTLPKLLHATPQVAPSYPKAFKYAKACAPERPRMYVPERTKMLQGASPCPERPKRSQSAPKRPTASQAVPERPRMFQNVQMCPRASPSRAPERSPERPWAPRAAQGESAPKCFRARFDVQGVPGCPRAHQSVAQRPRLSLGAPGCPRTYRCVQGLAPERQNAHQVVPGRTRISESIPDSI